MTAATTAPSESVSSSGSRDRLTNLLIRLPTSLASRLRVAWWRLLGARIGRRCRLDRIDIPRNPWDIELHDDVALDRGVVLLTTGTRTGSPRIVIGASCYVNRHTIFDASERIEVGRGAMIGPFCFITDHDHGIRGGEPIMRQPLVGTPTTIGDDVWLGAGVTVLKGVTIGDGAVIGAGSVVTRSIPPGAIAAGVPARAVGERT